VEYMKSSVKDIGGIFGIRNTQEFHRVSLREMAGIKNRGTQVHQSKKKYKRKTENKYEYCIECPICKHPFEPEFGETTCPECGGSGGS